MEKRKEVKQLAICAGTYPKYAIQFAKQLIDELKAAGFSSNIQHDYDYLKVVIKVKDSADAKETLEALNKTGYSGYLF